MRIAAMIAGGLLLAAGTLVAQDSPKPAGGEYTLRVGDREYAVQAGQPFTITTPGGEKLQAVLMPREVLRYEGHGITFNYPRAMKLTESVEEGIVTLNVEATESPLLILQLYPTRPDPAELQKVLVNELRSTYTARGMRVAPGSRPVRRTFGGTARAGVQMEATLAGEKLRTELYAFPLAGGTAAVMLQHMLDDDALAKRYFPLITESLRPVRQARLPDQHRPARAPAGVPPR